MDSQKSRINQAKNIFESKPSQMEDSNKKPWESQSSKVKGIADKIKIYNYDLEKCNIVYNYFR
jgi:hypothetical protein